MRVKTTGRRGTVNFNIGFKFWKFYLDLRLSKKTNNIYETIYQYQNSTKIQNIHEE